MQFSVIFVLPQRDERVTLLGGRNYLARALATIYGRGAVEHCKAFLHPQRWAKLEAVCFAPDPRSSRYVADHR